jgi:predicted permease
MFSGLRDLWRTTRRRSRFEAELDEELQSHCRERAAHLVAQGLEPEAARLQAERELELKESNKHAVRQARGLQWLDEFVQDVRFATRLLTKSPGFAVVAVISLMLGVGANIVVFSVTNALLLRPLGIQHPEDVVFVERSAGPTHSYPDYVDLRDHGRSFSSLAGYRIAPMGVETSEGADRLWGYLVTPNYFQLLGVHAERGRLFETSEDRPAGASPYVVLSHSCWHDRFGGDPEIVGKTIRVNARPFTVLGIAPAGFQGTELFYWPELWVPIAMEPQIEGHDWLDNRATKNLMVIGRLKGGVTRAQATADFNALAIGQEKSDPIWDSGMHYLLSTPGLVGNSLRGPVESFAVGVLLLAALVLLAACANLAGMLTARSADRQRELSVRLAIGAARSRIVRQLLAESLLLSILGGVAGLALAQVLLTLLSHWRAPFGFPAQFAVEPDARVALFAVVVSLLTGVLFGIGPARQMSTTRVSLAFRGSTPPTRFRGWAFRDLVLLVQVALCCVLVTACFVGLRGLSKTMALPLGWEPSRVAVAAVDLRLSGYAPATVAPFQRRALDTLAQIPGVERASFSNTLPLNIDQSFTSLWREDTPDYTQKRSIEASFYLIAPGYLRTVGTRLAAGRDFTWQDDATRPEQALINQALARQLFGKGSAVGHHFRVGPKQFIEIVGVVEDGKYVTLAEQDHPAIFEPILQHPNDATVFAIRTARQPAAVAAEMRRVLLSLDPHLTLHDVDAAENTLGLALFPARVATIALGSFGLLAMMLAVTGIYALSAYSVSQRTKEICLRLAVGARPIRLLASILGRAAVVLGTGSLVGVLIGLGTGPVLANVVPGASPREPVILVAVAVTMALVGIVAAASPARRALSVEPSIALRGD